MYGKIFDSIYDGTLYGHWEAIITMQQLIVLATPDGLVDMTPQAISARTSIPIEIISKGLKVLADPDPHTRTPGDEGRRIVLVDDHRPWGWRLVNHGKYMRLRDMDQKRQADRERMSEKRRKIRDVATGSLFVANVAHSDLDSDLKPPVVPQGGRDRAYEQIIKGWFEKFWTAYPRHIAKQSAIKAWAKLKPTPALITKIMTALERAKKSDQWVRDSGRYIPHPATWLNGHRFEDDLPPAAAARDDRKAVM